MRRRSLVAGALAAGLLLVTACSGDAPKPSRAAERTEVLADVSRSVMLPAYEQLATSAQRLEATLTSYCAAPSEAGLTAAQDAWRDTRAAWRATDAFRFGPATNLRLASAIDFPIDDAKVDALIAGRDPLTPDALAALGADVRGLGVVEDVLFSATPDTRACTLAASASGLVATATGRVAELWRTEFAESLANPSKSAYLNEQAALDDIVNGMILALADLSSTRLGKAAGMESGLPETAAVDPGEARNAAPEAAQTLASVRAVYGDAERGVRREVAAMSPNAAKRLDAQLQQAAEAVDALPSPLATARDVAPIKAADDRVREILVTLRTEVASLLGVTLSLGDADGDS